MNELLVVVVELFKADRNSVGHLASCMDIQKYISSQICCLSPRERQKEESGSPSIYRSRHIQVYLCFCGTDSRNVALSSLLRSRRPVRQAEYH